MGEAGARFSRKIAMSLPSLTFRHTLHKGHLDLTVRFYDDRL